MSRPWVPPYFGSWQELINSLLHNPYLATAAPAPPPSDPHSPPRAPPRGPAGGPQPSPLRITHATLVALVGTGQVARALPEGRLKQEMTAGLDRAVADVIDDWCGTRPRPWPPHPGPGPRADTATLVAALGVAAQTFGASGMRDDLLRVAGQLVQKAGAAPANRERKMPTPEEFDAMEKEVTARDGQCHALCSELLRDLEELQDLPPGPARHRLLIRIVALRAQMKALKCGPCLPE